MAAEVIFFKHKSDPTSPLVSNALTVRFKALKTVSKAPAFLQISSQVPSYVLVTLCNYLFTGWPPPHH